MNNLYKEITENLTEQELFEMANLHPIDTRLPSEINSIFEGAIKYPQHGPRVKVRTSRGWIPIAVGKTVFLAVNMKFKIEDQNKIDAAIEYVTKHKKSFIDHWNGLITDKGLFDEVIDNKKVKRINKQKVGV